MDIQVLDLVGYGAGAFLVLTYSVIGYIAYKHSQYRKQVHDRIVKAALDKHK